VVTRVCVSVCLSAAACPHYCTDPDVAWGSGRGCPIVVHYCADLQSLHGLRCYSNITRTRNVSEYMLVLALYALFDLLYDTLYDKIHDESIQLIESGYTASPQKIRNKSYSLYGKSCRDVVQQIDTYNKCTTKLQLGIERVQTCTR